MSLIILCSRTGRSAILLAFRNGDLYCRCIGGLGGIIAMTKSLGEITASALSDFANVGALAGIECDLSKIRVEVLDKPHLATGFLWEANSLYA